VVHAVLRACFGTKARGGVGLGVQVKKENFFPTGGEACREVNRSRCLSDSSFLVSNGDDSHSLKRFRQKRVGQEDAEEVKRVCEGTYCFPNSLERRVALLTALMTVDRKAPASRAASPEMVVPPGEVTRSRSSAGRDPLSRTKVAAPRTV
jgi:hypothetical protein